MFVVFCFVLFYFDLPWKYKTFDLVHLINPFYPSSSSLLMTLLGSFPGLGNITVEEHQHDNIILRNIVSGSLLVQPAKLPIRFFSTCSSLYITLELCMLVCKMWPFPTLSCKYIEILKYGVSHVSVGCTLWFLSLWSLNGAAEQSNITFRLCWTWIISLPGTRLSC